MAKIKTIGILTSGGDAPGMNAAIRAVTRAGISNGFKIKGIYRGYDGLINGEVKEFTTEDVSGIITRGGTILKTARSQEFMTLEGQQRAYETLQKEEIDALVVIGGNGSLTGARNFAREFDVPCIGLPGTIDNDLYGTDFTFGFHTAMDIATEVIDRIHTTAASHGRCMVVEIMGNKAGWLTLYSGVAGGADAILIPEIPYKIEKVAKVVESRAKSNKGFTIIAVAEGAMTPEEAKMGKKEREAKRAAEEKKNNKYIY